MHVVISVLLLASVGLGAPSRNINYGKDLTLPQTTGAVTGRVTDQRGDAISGAQIVATFGRDGNLIVRTDEQGRYRLDLPAGYSELHGKAKGFSPHTQRVTVVAGRETTVDWTLEVEAIPEIVTITPARVERGLDQLPASVTVLEASDVRNSAAQTVDDLLRQIPGFSIFRRSSSLVANPTTQGVSLRGAGASGASRTVVLTDGLPLNDGFGGWVYWDRVPRAAIAQIEVVRGGSSDLYGSDALSGVINLISRPPSTLLFSGEASYGNRDTADVTFFSSAAWKGWEASLTGEATRTDGYFIVAPERRGPADQPAASNHRVLTLRLSRSWGSAAPGSVFVRGSLFAEDRKNGTPLQRNDTTTESLAVGTRLRTSDGSNWQATLFGNQQRFHQTFTAVSADRTSETFLRSQAVPSRDAGFFLNWSRVFAERHLLVAGSDLRGVRGSSDELVYTGGRPTSFVSAGGRQRRLGFFGQDLISLTSRWQLVVSARYDQWRDSSAYSIDRTLATGVVRPTFFAERTKDAFSPRVAVLFRASESVTLRAAGYRAFRAPTLNELYRSFRVGDTLTLSNEQLEAERLSGGEGGVGWTVGNSFTSRVTGYWTETVNPITNFTLSATPTLITRQRRNLGRTRSRGIEVETDLKLGMDWHLTAGYLLSDTAVRQAPQDVRLIGLWIPQVPRHQFTLQTVYSNARYVTAALQFRATGHQFDDDQNRFVLDSFAVVDLLAERQLHRSIDAFIAVQNVLDQRYAVGRTPLETIGAPRLVRGGLRVRFGK